MGGSTPTVYLFYGNDKFTINETIASMRSKLGDPSTADMNLQRFLGPDLEISDLIQSCTIAPFIAHRRLTIVDKAERLPSSPEWQSRFFEFLDTLPETCALVLIEDTGYYRNKKKKYESSSRIFQWVQDHPEAAYVQAYFVPRDKAFVSWIQNRCRMMGGEIEPAAAQLLADWVSEDPFLSSEELAKLLDYVDRSRPIEVEDVQQLTPYRGQEDIFSMVDALGQRRGKTAQKYLHGLLAEEDIRYVFAMIIRQFRLLILSREALELGDSPKQSLPKNTPDFVVNKISAQTKKFSMDLLERIYHELLAIDLASKFGGLDLATSLDSFIAKYCS
jgi:DNA polymerase-3 subunit delta